MKEKKKKRDKPDLVVYSDDKGYYSRELTYGSNVGAPAIKLEDVTGWKKTQALVANKQFKSKYEELREEFKRLVDEVSWNEFVYSSTYNFLPVMSETYFLYERSEGNIFLSLIRPSEWKMKFLGATKLDSTQKWIKIPYDYYEV